MGVSVLYSAIPPTSRLYARLQHERAFNVLMVALFPYGNRIFRFFEIEPDEVEEILEFVIDAYQDIFGSESAADAIIDEFRAELLQTRAAYPGIEDRTASLEKSSIVIQERLTQQLSQQPNIDAIALVEKLLYGDQTLGSTLPANESLRLISHELVQHGAKILQQVDPDSLLADNEWYRSHFQWWRNLYFAAAERNEIILVAFA